MSALWFEMVEPYTRDPRHKRRRRKTRQGLDSSWTQLQLRQRELRRYTRRSQPSGQPTWNTRHRLKRIRSKTKFFHLVDNFNIAPDTKSREAVCVPAGIKSKERSRYQETTVCRTSSLNVGNTVPRVPRGPSVWCCHPEHWIGHQPCLITIYIDAVISWTNNSGAIVKTHLENETVSRKWLWNPPNNTKYDFFLQTHPPLSAKPRKSGK